MLSSTLTASGMSVLSVLIDVQFLVCNVQFLMCNSGLTWTVSSANKELHIATGEGRDFLTIVGE